MKKLGQIALLFGEHVSEIEKARQIFTSEIRTFTREVVVEARKRSEPWTTGLLRITIEQEIENEGRVTGYFSSQFALGRATVRFKKETRFVCVATVNFGIGWSDGDNAFMWYVEIVPAARYPQLDDVLWKEWQAQSPRIDIPGGKHQSMSNQLRLCARTVDGTLTGDQAKGDVVQVFEFVLRADKAVGEAVGLHLAEDERASATPVTAAG